MEMTKKWSIVTNLGDQNSKLVEFPRLSDD
jgi:hypothetical protein